MSTRLASSVTLLWELHILHGNTDHKDNVIQFGLYCQQLPTSSGVTGNELHLIVLHVQYMGLCVNYMNFVSLCQDQASR